MNLTKIKNGLGFVGTVVLGTALVVGFVSAATTISTDVTTAGSMYASTTVQTAAFTNYGLSTLANASSTGITSTGNIWVNGFATTTASNGNFATAGTLTATGISTLLGATYASSTLQGTGITDWGNTALKGTLNVTGVSTLTGVTNQTGAAYASSSLQVSGTQTNFGLTTLAGTTTLQAGLISTKAAMCIEFYATSTATKVNMTFAATSTASGATATGVIPVVAYGTCN